MIAYFFLQLIKEKDEQCGPQIGKHRNPADTLISFDKEPLIRIFP